VLLTTVVGSYPQPNWLIDREPPERLVLAPDCGMKYLPRDRAFRKLQALVEGARVVREQPGA
jgi:5-methyltetrahydropteroyltriglutamate--homocysteine methyltransferase